LSGVISANRWVSFIIARKRPQLEGKLGPSLCAGGQRTYRHYSVIFGPGDLFQDNCRFIPSSPKFTFGHFTGNEIPQAAFRRWAVGRIRWTIVLSRDYFVNQVASLLKFAKETTNPQLAAVLIAKAADLKSQVDESSTTPKAPDVGPETSPLPPDIADS